MSSSSNSLIGKGVQAVNAVRVLKKMSDCRQLLCTSKYLVMPGSDSCCILNAHLMYR